MIYLDSSVALAHLLAEDRSPTFDERMLAAARALRIPIFESVA